MKVYEGWVVRGLAPDRCRIELSELGPERDESRMMHAMGLGDRQHPPWHTPGGEGCARRSEGAQSKLAQEIGRENGGCDSEGLGDVEERNDIIPASSKSAISIIWNEINK